MQEKDFVPAHIGAICALGERSATSEMMCGFMLYNLARWINGVMCESIYHEGESECLIYNVYVSKTYKYKVKLVFQTSPNNLYCEVLNFIIGHSIIKSLFRRPTSSTRYE